MSSSNRRHSIERDRPAARPAGCAQAFDNDQDFRRHQRGAHGRPSSPPARRGRSRLRGSRRAGRRNGVAASSASRSVDPAEILRLQFQAGQRIGAVRVEAGGDHACSSGRNRSIAGSTISSIGVAELVRRRRTAGSGALQILPTPRSVARAGAGIERHLVGRGVEDLRVVLEDVLRAVAVMHVEIDDRDALQRRAPRAHARAPIATLLNRQKPIAMSLSA